jgi:aldehyde dehydrogenase (NAD+)
MTIAIDSAPQPHTELDRIPAIVAALRETFASGHTRPIEWRRAQLQALLRMLTEQGEALAAALHADLRKPMLEAWTADIGSVKLEAKHAIKNLKKWTRPQRAPGVPVLGRMRVINEPLGCVLIISPWNYPVQLLLSPLVGAIAAGNCALLKPSEVTPHTSALLAKIVSQYLDPDAITLVEGAVDETTALLDERWDHIFYTGNGSVARIVMAAAAKNLTPVTLELGGKSPCIVDRDVELSVTARRIAWGKFMNAGQTCIAPDYVLVHRDREDELVRELGKCIRDFYGSDPKSSPDFARIVNERHHRRVTRLLKDGEPAVGGEHDESDGYIAPTVLRGVDAESAIMQEEIFGPVLPILPIDDVDQAIDFVNERDKPLALYLFTNDSEVESEVLSRTSSGGACVNGTILHISDPKLPFGGVGESGLGAYHGRHSFETFSHRKAVLTRGFRFDPKLMYPPYSKLRTALLTRLL